MFDSEIDFKNARFVNIFVWEGGCASRSKARDAQPAGQQASRQAGRQAGGQASQQARKQAGRKASRQAEKLTRAN